jgi:hypothetical protein
MGQPLDPTSVAGYVAAVKAKTDDNAFAVTSTTTGLIYGCSAGVPDVHAKLYKPGNRASARMFSWIARYRYRGLSAWLVGDVAFTQQVTGILALLALDQMGLIDVRYPKNAFAPFNPALGGSPEDPAPLPKMKWVALSGGAGYWAR